MENIQHAVMSAMEAKPLEFKKHIEDEINNRIQTLMQARKQDLAKNILNPSEDSDEDEFEEDNNSEETDEEL